MMYVPAVDSAPSGNWTAICLLVTAVYAIVGLVIMKKML